MRAFSSASVVTVAAAVSLLATPAAFASPSGGPGTVRVHDAASGREPAGDERRVCSFRLVASGFEGRQQVGWKVVERISGTVAETGEVLLDGEGAGRSGDLALDDGRYRLVWNYQVRQGADAGSRVFAVDCDGVPEALPSVEPGPVGGETPVAEDTNAEAEDTDADATDVEATGAGTTPAAESTPGAGPTGAEAVPDPSRTGGLATTGSEVPAGALAAAGASLLGAGTYLVLRRREWRAQQRR